MEARDFSALRISLASPEQIRSWSYGEVTKPETINYRRLRPEMDGLFCERTFGPTRDWQCYCGKYKNIRYRGIVCDKCGVEVTRSSVRRERMGHIELAAPVAHVWYTRRVPSYLGLLLDVSRRNLDRVLYFAQYVITQVDEDARKRAISRIHQELENKESALKDEIDEQMADLRVNRDRAADKFDRKVGEIDQHFEKERDRLSDAAVREGRTIEDSISNLLGNAAPSQIRLESAGKVVVELGETITSDHVSRMQAMVAEYLSALETEMAALKTEEIQKISGDIDQANADVESAMNEHLLGLEEKMTEMRANAEAQLTELRELQALQFLSEGRYRDLKGKFGNVFQADMGAEAFHEILKNLNLKKLEEELWHEVRTTRSKQRARKATKRLGVVERLTKSRETVVDSDRDKKGNEPDGNRPQWMILTVLPVIPPDLRPMVQLDGGRFATSDLNDLYRRVINRNNRLKHLLDLGAPDVIVRNEKRMLQEAVDSLIDNSQRGKALSRRGRRELKSLSDMLKGKKGRFRRNLLGKRVDYSGRSVIVIGPKLKLHQCGLPKSMALELYRPFVISKLVEYNYASNVKGAKRIIEREQPEVWEVLEEVIQDRPVLLNRAPTLHRLGIQAFEPLLVEGKAIQIHPLVCSAFNADFDGDQMAVHVPLSEAAVKEARELMLSTRNLLKPSDGAPIVGPAKDMVLGNYYLTMDPTVEILALRSRADEFRSEQALYSGQHTVGIAERSNGYYYAQFRQIPQTQLFMDEVATDSSGRQRVVNSAIDLTIEALLAGEVDCLLANAYEMRRHLRARKLEDQLAITNLHERRVVVDMDEVEYLYRIGLVGLHTPILLGNVYDDRSPQAEPEICTVGRAIFNRILPDEMRFVQETMGKKGLQELVARCYQVIGADRTTEVVDAVKNFGFHYATISGTTIAVSDLSTPDERQDIMQQADLVVQRAERDYRRGLMTQEERYQITVDEWTRAKDDLQDQIEVALDPYGPIAIMARSGATKGGYGPITQLAGMRGLMADAAGRIIELPIRSNFRQGLNTLEYFMSSNGARKGLADTALRTADAGYLTRRLVDVAQDMIVNRIDCHTSNSLEIRRSDDIGGQSISERIVGRCAAVDMHDPDTGELIVSRNEMIDEDIADRLQQSSLETFAVRSPLTCDLIHGCCALCYGRDLGTGEMVNIGAAVGIIAAQSIGEPGTQLTLRTFHAAGAVYAQGDITSGLPRVEELFEARRKPKGESVVTEHGGILRLSEREDGARIATVIDETMESETHIVPEGWEILVEDRQEVKARAALATDGEEKLKAAMSGVIHLEEDTVFIRKEIREENDYELPANARLRKEIYDGMTIEPGEQLTEGSKSPHRVLQVQGTEATQLYLLSEIQEVYRSQGVNIADKHFETVIRKMMCKVQVTKTGDSDLLPGDLIDERKLREINENLRAEDKEICSASPVLLGITKAALETDSYLSAASFQHTIKVLAGAAIEGQIDPLHGLKENVIIGKLIPAGTGFHAYQDREAIAPITTLEEQGALKPEPVIDFDDFEQLILSEL
ncbi:MAG: DNA-directed RNA polymerase subunit beta' [Chloroflexi bacterium]|nr:DNA-directed RNA polymerase subunit beta' [Chloroflexota bacterium]MCY4246934.1 DNA-directed RNA polymerase subunit beta' [Chloroflexota bacterium]